MRLARALIVQTTLFRGWSWSWHTQTARVGDSVRRLIEEFCFALASESLRQVVAFGVLVAVVLSKAAFVDEGRAANAAWSIRGVRAFIHEVVSAAALVGIGCVLAVGIWRTVVTTLDALVDP